MDSTGNWLGHWLLAAFLGAAGFHLWPYGQAPGGELACVASAVLWVLTVRAFFRGLSAWDYTREMRRVHKRSQAPSPVHGQARWGTLREAQAAGMTAGQGVFIGRLDGRDLFYPGAAHLMTIAPARAGKGTSIVVPNLLTYRGSMIVTDPKGELCAMTARHRRTKLGQRVIVLNPWREKLARELGIDLGDAGFNPLCLLKPGPDVKDDAALLAEMLVPGRPDMSESEAFFVSSGRSILIGSMLHLLSKSASDVITLPELRHHLMAASEGLEEFLAHMATSDAFGGVVAEYGGKFVNARMDSPKQFQGSLSTAQESLEIYDGFGAMGAHVASGDFSFESCKSEPTTVYLIMPSDRAGTHAAWLNLVISVALELVGRDRSSERVLFMLDEFANLGYLPGVLRAMAQYSGQGVQVHTIWQQISQAERVYKSGWREFVGLSELINTFGVWEPETLKLISEWIGNETVRDLSYSSPANDRFAGGEGVSLSANDRARALIRPEEVRTMPSDRQLVFYRNLPPIMAEKVSYLTERKWRRLVDENPYHRKRAHAVT